MSDQDFPPPPDWDEEDDPFYGLYGSEEAGDDPTGSYIDIGALLEGLGIESAEEFVVELDALTDPSTLRSIRFSTLEESIIFLAEIGVLAFADVVLIDEEEFGVSIPEFTP
jgi:hypothetical protein